MAGQATILVVEDDADHAALALRSLRDAPGGLRGVAAFSAEEAVGFLDDHRPDLLVVDYSLPGMNGLELMSRLRSRGDETPAVMMTSTGSETVAVEALRAGFSDYLIKSPAIWELLPLVAAKVITRHRNAERLARLEALMLDVAAALEPSEVALRVTRGIRTLLDCDGAAAWDADQASFAVWDGPLGRELLDYASARDLSRARPGALRATPALLLRELRSERGRLVGTLAAAFCDQRTLTSDENQVVAMFVRFAATALENSILLARERSITSRLQELDQLKSDFLSQVSHELLTPLTVIDGFARMLTARWDDISDTDRQDDVGRIVKHSADLTRLIYQLLEYSRLEKVEVPEPEPTHVAGVAAEVVERLDSGRIRLGSLNATVMCTPEALSSILLNLLTNALKFSPPSEPVEVSVTAGENEATITVNDRGPGVAGDERERIFQRFYRGSAARGVRGTGVGLAVVARYAEGYSGAAWVEPRKGGGASFRVRLPLAPARRGPP